MNQAPYILLDDQIAPSARWYEMPLHIIQANTPDEVPSALNEIMDYHGQGYHLAGYAAYELGYVLEPKLAGLMPQARAVPLLQFGVFEGFQTAISDAPLRANPLASLSLSPEWHEAAYTARFNQVIEYIKAGDVYQINLTFPLIGTYEGSALDLYAALRRRQPGGYGGVVSLGGPDIISLSPELFFKTTGQKIEMRPMKGTARRQADPVQDEAQRQAMRADAKSQAENLMIVDLLRNDLSRISMPGTVKVPELFALETYPTLHQMTSHVTANLNRNVDITDVFRSLFPCGSITGAPKIRAMEIINELEDGPRGAYCGAIGYMDPGGEACFNVAIRTLTLNAGRAVYNVGSGLVLDSRAKDEYAECLLKAKVLAAPGANLIETLRWVPEAGGLRAGRHMARMARSAAALDYPFPKAEFTRALESIAESTPQRVRMVLTAEGTLTCETCEFQPVMSKWKVSLCCPALTLNVQETAHKISARGFYDGQRRRIAAITGCDEVLFFNDKDELCEGSFTSVFVQKVDQLYTPPLSCGLLPGILREEMIESGQAQEAHLTLSDLISAGRIYVGNSLRGLIAVELTDTQRH